MFDFFMAVADTAPFSIQSDVTLKTNFFATRDMCNVFLPIIKPGGKSCLLYLTEPACLVILFFSSLTHSFFFLGRMVNVSSVMGSVALSRCSPELQARFRSDDITEEELVGLMERFVRDAQEGVHAERGWPSTAYGVSKTGLTTLTRIMARNLTKERPGDEILINACCPGWVRTDMAGPNATKSPDEGAITPVYLALLPAGAKEPHGQFVSEKKVQPWWELERVSVYMCVVLSWTHQDLDKLFLERFGLNSDWALDRRLQVFQKLQWALCTLFL